jgi:hypothetical protein
MKSSGSTSRVHTVPTIRPSWLANTIRNFSSTNLVFVSSPLNLQEDSKRHRLRRKYQLLKRPRRNIGLNVKRETADTLVNRGLPFNYLNTYRCLRHLRERNPYIVHVKYSHAQA